MNIIFLDVDGPLIPGRMHYNAPDSYIDIATGNYLWDAVAVNMLSTLCSRFGAKVVFSTSHNENSLDAMREKCEFNGLSIKFLHDTVRTGFRIDSYSKKDAIVQWLREHPETDRWVLVDDEDILPYNQVRVDFSVGISAFNYSEIERFLENK